MLNREDMIKMLDIALERFPEDFKYQKCAFCGVLPEAASVSIAFEPGHAKFTVYRWITDRWLFINSSVGHQKNVCPDCVKAKGLI